MINTNEVLKALYNILDSQNKQDNNARLLSLEEILDWNTRNQNIFAFNAKFTFSPSFFLDDQWSPLQYKCYA